MMIMYMTGVSPIVQTLLVNALTLLLYFGLARGVVEAWWLGIALSLMGMANAIAAPGSAGPGVMWLLEGLALTVLSGLLYLFGWSRWRAAHSQTSRFLISFAGNASTECIRSPVTRRPSSACAAVGRICGRTFGGARHDRGGPCRPWPLQAVTAVARARRLLLHTAGFR